MFVGRVDGARLVDVGRGEVEVGVAEDQVGQRPLRLGAEVADGLEVRPAEEPPLDRPDVRRELGDDADRASAAVRVVDRLGLDAVVVPQLVPEVPGEDGPRAPPALDGEGDPPLDGRHALGVRQQVELPAARAAPVGVVGVVVPHHPGEEGVERRQQEPEPVPLAEGDQVVDGLDRDRVELAAADARGRGRRRRIRASPGAS